MPKAIRLKGACQFLDRAVNGGEDKRMGGDSNAYSVAEAARMLAWWLEAGVDVATQEEPRNWLKARVAETPALPLPADTRQADPAVEMPDSFAPFRDWLGSSLALPLASPSARRVLPKGPENAPIMLLSDSPSFEDAAAGDPISGETWALTERMLDAIKIPAEQAYVASVSCFHAPGSRMTDNDLSACAAIVRRQIALARPKRLLLLGDTPSRALLGKPFTSARGHVHKVEGVRTVVTFHPRQLLKRPSDKALAWRDLLLLMDDDQ
jgi:uracil-DNA glycosylase family 4